MWACLYSTMSAPCYVMSIIQNGNSKLLETKDNTQKGDAVQANYALASRMEYESQRILIRKEK